MTKVIPPAFFIFCSTLMLALHFYFPILELFPFFTRPLGILLVPLGLIFTLMVRKQFSNVKTEIHTFKRPVRLITNGLFCISRNPIYLGFGLTLTGIWLICGTLSPFAGTALFIVVTHYWYIPIEEKNMEYIFGKEYLDYKARVRRWL